MIIPALIVAALLPLPAKAPSGPKPESPVLALSACADCTQLPAVVAGGAPASFTALWRAHSTFHAFYRTFAVQGHSGPEIQIARGHATRPAGVGVTAAGSFVLGWLHPGEVFVRRLDPPGNLAGDPIHINASHPLEVHDDNASIAVRGDGGFLAIWDRLQRDTKIVVRRADTNGALEPEVVIGESMGSSSPVACFTPSGGNVAAWTLRREFFPDTASQAGIALRRLAPDGAPVGEVVELRAPDEITYDLGLALACAPDGGFVVAWHTRRRPAKAGFDIVLQRFNAAGAKSGQTVRMNTGAAGDQTSPALLFEKNGKLLVVWASAAGGKGEIRGRRLSAKGAPTGAELVLHRAGAGINPVAPAIAAVGERGQFVVTWNERD